MIEIEKMVGKISQNNSIMRFSKFSFTQMKERVILFAQQFIYFEIGLTKWFFAIHVWLATGLLEFCLKYFHVEGKMTKQTFHSVMAQSKHFGSKLNSSNGISTLLQRDALHILCSFLFGLLKQKSQCTSEIECKSSKC